MCVNEKNGIVSIVFDDTIKNQLIGLELANKFGYNGTLGVVTGRVGQTYKHGDKWQVTSMTWSEIAEFKNMGWEIASHSKMHRSIDNEYLHGPYKKLSLEELEEEVLDSKLDLINKGYNPITFIWPGGPSQNPCTKRELNTVKKHYEIIRFFLSYGRLYPDSGYLDKPNFNPFSTSPYNLLGTYLYSYRGMLNDLNNTLKNLGNRWLILSLHGIGEKIEDSVDITPSDFEKVLATIENSGINVVTLEEGKRFLTKRV